MKKLFLILAALAASLAASSNAMALLSLPDLSDLLRLQIEEYEEEKEAILAERQSLAERIRDLSPTDRRAAIAEFQAEHADRLAAHRELGEEIRSEMRELRGAYERTAPVRPDRPVGNRPELSAGMQDLTSDFQAARDQLLSQKQEILENLKGASNEERQAAMAQWREERRALIANLQAAAAQLKHDVREEREQRRSNARQP